MMNLPFNASQEISQINAFFGSFDGLEIAFGGELRGNRIVRSLAYIAALHADNSLTFVARPDSTVDDDIRRFLDERDTIWHETDDIHSAVTNADVVHWTHRRGHGRAAQIHREIINQAIARSINPAALLIVNNS